jgi:hypothetical protein
MAFDSVTAFAWLNVRLVVLVATLMPPVSVNPLCSVRVLLPPVKLMALARVVPSPDRPPAIVPLLMIVRPLP